MFVWWLRRVHGNVPEDFFFPLFKALPAGESPEGWLKDRIVHNYLEKQSGMLTPVTKRAIHNVQKDKTQPKCFRGSLASFNSPIAVLTKRQGRCGTQWVLPVPSAFQAPEEPWCSGWEGEASSVLPPPQSLEQDGSISPSLGSKRREV